MPDMADDTVNLIVKCSRIRLAFQEIYKCPSRDWAELVLDHGCSWAIRSRLEPIRKVARTVKQHRDGFQGRSQAPLRCRY